MMRSGEQRKIKHQMSAGHTKERPDDLRNEIGGNLVWCSKSVIPSASCRTRRPCEGSRSVPLRSSPVPVKRKRGGERQGQKVPCLGKKTFVVEPHNNCNPYAYARTASILVVSNPTITVSSITITGVFMQLARAVSGPAQEPPFLSMSRAVTRIAMRLLN
jgi:hypothetical protein